MDKIKLTNFESISIVLIITITHSILTLPKTIISSIGSSSILNLIYISIVAFIIVLLICKLMNKFPGMDLIDISEFLGGKFFKFIVGTLFLIYILFISSTLLRTFSNCLQIVYYPVTKIFFIISLFIIGASLACYLRFNAVLKSNILIIPIAIFSMLFLFIANTKYFNICNIFPILGNGFDSTFISGVTNIFAFGGIAFLYLLPTKMKNPNQFKKIAILSIAVSSIYLLLTISSVLFMFNNLSLATELLPLYSTVRYIEFGTFFQRLDSIYLLIWILCFFSYLGTTFTFSINTFKKITNIKNSKQIIAPLALLILAFSLLPKNEAISNFLESTVYKYIFIIFVIIICFSILILSTIKKRLKNKTN